MGKGGDTRKNLLTDAEKAIIEERFLAGATGGSISREINRHPSTVNSHKYRLIKLGVLPPVDKKPSLKKYKQVKTAGEPKIPTEDEILAVLGFLLNEHREYREAKETYLKKAEALTEKIKDVNLREFWIINSEIKSR